MLSPIIVLGHQRSGTNFVNELLQYNSKVSMLDEPFSMHTSYLKDLDLKPWTADSYDSLFLHKDLHNTPSIVLFLQAMKQWLTRPPDSCVRGFKETIFFEKAPWLDKFLPGARYVFVLRDPRAIVASVLKVKRSEDLWALESRTLEYITSAYSTNIAPPKTRAEIIAWSIKLRWDIAHRYLLPVATMKIRLEDLVDDHENSLARLMQFVGLESTRGQIDFLEKSQLSTRGGMYSSFRSKNDIKHTWRKLLTKTESNYIERLLSDYMQEYDYS